MKTLRRSPTAMMFVIYLLQLGILAVLIGSFLAGRFKPCPEVHVSVTDQGRSMVDGDILELDDVLQACLSALLAGGTVTFHSYDRVCRSAESKQLYEMLNEWDVLYPTRTRSSSVIEYRRYQNKLNELQARDQQHGERLVSN